MFIGSREVHKNQRTNTIRVSLFAGNSSKEAQSNIQENEEVGGVRQLIPEVRASSLVWNFSEANNITVRRFAPESKWHLH